jgi:5-methylcytosine-specific restriction protein B
MEALTTILPYSKEAFSVPPNLYLIGAMNSTDHSVAQMDMALRRRFAFKELLPEPEQISKFGRPMAAGINLETMLRTMNLRISLLLGKDYQIGHAYFLNIQTLDDIKKLFSQQVLPLLQEYFYDDLGKLGLILGKDFIEEVPTDTKDIFADFPHAAFDHSPRRQLYRLRPMSELDENAFIHIYDESYHHAR